MQKYYHYFFAIFYIFFIIFFFTIFLFGKSLHTNKHKMCPPQCIQISRPFIRGSKNIIIIRVLRRAFLCCYLYSQFRLIALFQSCLTFQKYFKLYFVFSFLDFHTIHHTPPTIRPPPQAGSVVLPKAEAHRPMGEEGGGRPTTRISIKPPKRVSTIRGDMVSLVKALCFRHPLRPFT